MIKSMLERRFRFVKKLCFFRKFHIKSGIAGLLVLQHKLEFLGLFDADERGSARQWLPAKRVNIIKVTFCGLYI
jgi:hypothetical protein